MLHVFYSRNWIIDFSGSGELEFEEFVTLAAGFLTEDEPEDVEAMQAELKEAFRLYDKEGLIQFCNYIIATKQKS